MGISRRQFLLLGGGLAAAATLSACGGNTGRGPQASGSPAPGASSGEAGGAASGVTLSHWYHEYGEKGVKDAVQKYARAYDKAKVEVKWNVGEYGKLLGAALLTDQGPDVFEAEMGASLDMIKAGQVVDLTELMTPHLSEFNPAVLKRFSYQDKFYAIPQAVDMQVLYYRKSVLDKATVQPPTTFEELISVAKTVAEKTGKKMGGFFAGNDGGLAVLANVLIWASGLEQVNGDGTDIGFNDPAFFDAVAKYRDFAKSGGLLDSASKDWFDAAAFVNEETAMQWGGLWSMTDIKDAFKDDFGVMPFPKIGDKGRPAVPFGAFGCCVNAKSKHVEEAKAYAKWLWIDQNDKQLEFADAFGTHIPSRTDLVAKSKKLASGPGQQAANFVREYGFATDMRFSSAISEALGAALVNIVKKDADPKAEIAKVSETAKAELKRLS